MRSRQTRNAMAACQAALDQKQYLRRLFADAKLIARATGTQMVLLAEVDREPKHKEVLHVGIGKGKPLPEHELPYIPFSFDPPTQQAPRDVDQAKFSIKYANKETRDWGRKNPAPTDHPSRLFSRGAMYMPAHRQQQSASRRPNT